MPLWLGAKLQPRYSENAAWCTAMKAIALSGESTQNTTVSVQREVRDEEQSLGEDGSLAPAADHVLEARDVEPGAAQQHQREEELGLPAVQPPGDAPLFPGRPVVLVRPALGRPTPMSGSRPGSLGWAWWELCLGTHQP